LGNFKTLGEKCSAARLEVIDHNHIFEFKPMADGTILARLYAWKIQILLKSTSKWNLNSGYQKLGRPIGLLEKYQEDFKAWHVKRL